MISNKKLISIVIPVYNEEAALEYCYTRLKDYLGRVSKYEFEIIFTDNHSVDDTFNIIKRIANTDRSIRAFRFSKNFGYQKSILMGYMQSRGAAVIQLDVDLQDPIELISEFLLKWEEGYKVVYGIRASRKEGVFINILRNIFYKIISFASPEKLPRDAGDFRLCDRAVIEVLRGYRLTFPYLRGLIAEMGFRQIGIPYARDLRIRGESKFSFGDYVKFSINSLFAQSLVPLRLATALCMLLFTFGFLGAGLYLIGYGNFGAHWPPGFATLIITMLVGFGLLSLFIGILGEYLGRCIRVVEGKFNVILEDEL